jgi:hypothetical protein
VKVEGDGWLHGKCIHFADPVGRYTARHISAEGRVDVSICQDDGSCLEGWQDLALEPVSHVGGVDEAEGCRRQHLLLLPLLGRCFDQRGGVPFTEGYAISLTDEPLAQQVKLGTLARSVDALDNEQLAGQGSSIR